WWLYFDSAAAFNLRLLELSGGSPTIARAVFAVGHMLPAFALLVTAAGVGLLLGDDPPPTAFGLACTGIGIYLASSRAMRGAPSSPPALLGTVVTVATFFLARLHTVLNPHEYLWLLAGWVALCALLTTRTAGELDDDEALERYLGRGGGHAVERSP